MHNIAIIGGGTAAACLIDSLYRHLPPQKGTITIYEQNPENLWHGHIYQKDGSEIITNVPADAMSIRHTHPTQAVQWLHNNRYGTTQENLNNWCPPRAVIGRYITQTTTENIIKLNARGWKTRIIHEQATDTRPGPRVTTRLRTTTHHALILAVGHPDPPDHYQLQGHPQYIPTPYPTHKTLATIPAADDVTIIGTGLTAVDIVATLNANRHHGRIILTSRRGKLHTVRGPAPQHPPQYLTTENLHRLHQKGRYNLHALLTLIRDEITLAGHNPASLSHVLTDTNDPLARLTLDLYDPIPALAILQHAVPTVGQTAWSLLPAYDRRHILNNHHQAVMALCCPMPPVNAHLLVNLGLARQLQVLPGLHHIHSNGDRFLVSTRHRVISTDWVINAAGSAIREHPRTAHHAITSLIDQGLAQRDPFGGISVHPPTNRLITANHQADPHLYALGDLTHGSLYFTFGVSVLTTGADHIAESIATTL